MAVISVTKENGTGDSVIFTWSGMANGDTGEPVSFSDYTDRTISITGTFDGAVTLQGSNDKSTWVSQKDSAGTVISDTSNDGNLIGTNYDWTRPSVAAGTTANNKVMINAVRRK